LISAVCLHREVIAERLSTGRSRVAIAAICIRGVGDGSQSEWRAYRLDRGYSVLGDLRYPRRSWKWRGRVVTSRGPCMRIRFKKTRGGCVRRELRLRYCASRLPLSLPLCIPYLYRSLRRGPASAALLVSYLHYSTPFTALINIIAKLK